MFMEDFLSLYVEPTEKVAELRIHSLEQINAIITAQINAIDTNSSTQPIFDDYDGFIA